MKFEKIPTAEGKIPTEINLYWTGKFWLIDKLFNLKSEHGPEDVAVWLEYSYLIHHDYFCILSIALSENHTSSCANLSL